MPPFAVPFPNFNKFHLHPHFLPWILPCGHKEFGNLLTRDYTAAVNNRNLLPQHNSQLRLVRLTRVLRSLTTASVYSTGHHHELIQDYLYNSEGSYLPSKRIANKFAERVLHVEAG
jgi:hypothetical protein